MGEFYLHIVRKEGFGQRIIAALELIARPENRPLVFHCAIGKDRTGILAAFLLGALEVADEDIIEDYCLSAAYARELWQRVRSQPEMARAASPLPEYFWEASAESMAFFLAGLRKEYGSLTGYLEASGGSPSLVAKLKEGLLV